MVEGKGGAMTRQRLSQLRLLEGHQVCVSLSDGSRIDDCQLVSIGRSQVQSLWLFTNGHDIFVALDDVRDLWEIVHPRAA
jgi:hypothetical protein